VEEEVVGMLSEKKHAIGAVKEEEVEYYLKDHHLDHHPMG